MPQDASILTRALQTESLPADIDRLVQDVLLEAGVVDVGGDSFKVTEDTGSNLQVVVGSGSAGDKCVIKRGGRVYILEHQNASHTLLLSAADSNNDRIDLIIARIYDDEADSSGNTYGDIEVVEGTPAGSPAAPAVPDGAIALAEVLVAEDATAVTDGDITDLRSSARSGVSAPGGCLAYAERTSNQGSITAEADLTGLSVTVDIPANRRIRISATIEAQSTQAADVARLRIKEGSTALQTGNFRLGTSGTPFSCSKDHVFVPSAGEHTYKLSLERVGSGTVTMSAASGRAAFIMVEDLGPA